MMLTLVGGLPKSGHFETTHKHMETTTYADEVGVPVELELATGVAIALELYAFSKLSWPGR